MNKVLKAFVKNAQALKVKLAMSVVGEVEGSDEFFDALVEYNEFFFKVHNDLSKALQPLILSDDFLLSATGCKKLEELFNEFREPKTPAEKMASELCLKYSDII